LISINIRKIQGLYYSKMKMPLARYFFFVGGVLLALLFISDAYLPRFPIANKTGADLPVIRIHSDRKWPEAIVYDTGLPTIIPTHSVNREASVLNPATVTDVSAKTQAREAFAQIQPFDANRPQLSDPEKREAKLQRQRKIAKKRVAPRPVMVAQQPQFGLFGNRNW